MTTDKSSEREPTTRVKTFDDKTLVVEAATGAVIKNYHPRLTSMAVAFHEGIEYARAALPQQAQEAQAWRDVLAERKRQIDREGFRSERDDAYTRSELSAAACAYILTSRGFGRSAIRDFIWPETWTFGWFKPTSERRDLVKAGALILAEIERLDRAAIAKGERHER